MRACRYFKFERFVLPADYNAISNRLPSKGDASWGGTRPMVVHFTRDKPFGGRDPSIHGHRFLCLPDGKKQGPTA